MGQSVVKIQYSRSVTKVTTNLKYIGFRSRELNQDKGYFTATEDRTKDYRPFLQEMTSHPALQHGATVKAHMILLSFRREDYDALRAGGAKIEEVTREWVQQLERNKGMQLQWMASFHDSATHPHVHLTIRSVGITATGQNKRLFITQDDMPRLRQQLDDQLGRKAQYPMLPDLSDTLRAPFLASMRTFMQDTLDTRELDYRPQRIRRKQRREQQHRGPSL